MDRKMYILTVYIHDTLYCTVVQIMLSFGRTVWLYFIAVASHKYVLAFCIAMQLVTSGVRPCIRHEGGHKQTYKTKYNI